MERPSDSLVQLVEYGKLPDINIPRTRLRIAGEF